MTKRKGKLELYVNGVRFEQQPHFRFQDLRPKKVIWLRRVAVAFVYLNFAIIIAGLARLIWLDFGW